MSKVSSTPCHDFHLQMWLLLSGELSETEQKFWQRHLQTCARCQEDWTAAHTLQEQYKCLPAHDAPKRVILRLVQTAKSRRAASVWLRVRLHFFSAWNARPERRSRFALAGVALAMLLLAGFHYLAFRSPSQPAWEDAAFDEKARALASALQQYNIGPAQGIGDENFSGSSVEAQLMDLRENLAILTNDLKNSKL